jgi:pimeloyl-ACP methyl ester carboxylesterase
MTPHRRSRTVSPWLLAGLVLLSAALAGAQETTSPLAGLGPAEQAQIRSGMQQLEARLARLRSRAEGAPERLSDAEVYLKGAQWGARFEDPLSAADAALMARALERGTERAQALAAGSMPWATKKGRLVRGYRSEVDGSVQPYGLIVPDSYDPGKPTRLDVVLHGSSRPTGMSELRFMAQFEEGDSGGRPVAGQNWIELHPLGRVENCYRWAGETDVFEAIEDVCRSYAIDRDRIVLRGMSMGASGTWHLGLKHPDRFVALGPYCGYVDTHQFSLTPMQNFVKVGPLPEHQERALHMLDSIDYAANAGVVPVVAAIGDKDPFFQAHVLMGAAMEREGLHLLNLISPGTGHVQDPVTHREQMRRIGEIAARGLNHAPATLRFVTWTLKYPRCHWLEVLGMGEEYARAEMRASLAPDGSVRVEEPLNVTRFAVHPPVLQEVGRSLAVGGRKVRLPRLRPGEQPEALVIERRDGAWVCAGRLDRVRLSGKRPGVQSPIDDAFTRPFLCVRGTGAAWNPRVGAWADASLKRFAAEWSRYLRGDLPVKDDVDVTPEDLRRCNLVLFGDPGSNLWIRKALPKLPVRWSRSELRMAGGTYPAADHAPVLIQPNPLPGGEGRYLVLNSGHTFHEKELASLNYLLFPRLGDWAVMKLGDSEAIGEPLKAGFFNEQWAFGPPASTARTATR